MAKIIATPGIQIPGASAFPNSAAPVPSAVPAFIGYTEYALKNESDLKHVPTRIASFGEYVSYFGGAPKPVFKVKKSNSASAYELVEPTGRYLLYYAIQFFFANGGGDCWIVSIGNYHTPVNKEDMDGEALDDDKNIVLKGIRTLEKETEPTIVVIPDAVLLPAEDCAAIQKSMLAHCGFNQRNRFAILDVHDGFKPRYPDHQADVITLFRESIDDYLQWGAAYYPWVYTTITSPDVLDFRSVEENARADILAAIVEEADARFKLGAINKTQTELVQAEINKINTTSVDDANAVHQNLLALSPLYKTIMASLLEQINLLPPSAGIAGLYALVDRTAGIFHPPANISMASVLRPAVELSNEGQQDLHLPLSGKSVNAIRAFPGKGALVWGAHTLDGNSQDWRYIHVRRTVNFIEQSIKNAIEPYAFAPNIASTWVDIEVQIAALLTNIWQSGALAGASPDDAFHVEAGLGKTMTPTDVQDGVLRVSVKVALVRPAEFIVLDFEQRRPLQK